MISGIKGTISQESSYMHICIRGRKDVLKVNNSILFKYKYIKIHDTNNLYTQYITFERDTEIIPRLV